MFITSMPNSDDRVGVGRHRDEVPGDRRPSSPSAASIQSRAVRALVIVSSVVNVFDETMNSVCGRVEVAGGLGEVGAVDVGDEAEGQVAVAVVPQRLVGHHRAEVRAADADVDDVA